MLNNIRNLVWNIIFVDKENGVKKKIYASERYRLASLPDLTRLQGRFSSDITSQPWQSEYIFLLMWYLQVKDWILHDLWKLKICLALHFQSNRDHRVVWLPIFSKG